MNDTIAVVASSTSFHSVHFPCPFRAGLDVERHARVAIADPVRQAAVEPLSLRQHPSDRIDDPSVEQLEIRGVVQVDSAQP